jgi:tetratricopeptide (TPR) repeat protein
LSSQTLSADVLLRAGYGAFRVQEEDVAERLWSRIIADQTIPRILAYAKMSLGMLYTLRRDWHASAEAYQAAVDCGNTEVLAGAALGLAGIHHRAGRLYAAEAAYQIAIDAGEPLGAIPLGLLREERGNLTGAAKAYQSAIDSGDDLIIPALLS